MSQLGFHQIYNALVDIPFLSNYPPSNFSPIRGSIQRLVMLKGKQSSSNPHIFFSCLLVLKNYPEWYKVRANQLQMEFCSPICFYFHPSLELNNTNLKTSEHVSHIPAFVWLCLVLLDGWLCQSWNWQCILGRKNENRVPEQTGDPGCPGTLWRIPAAGETVGSFEELQPFAVPVPVTDTGGPVRPGWFQSLLWLRLSSTRAMRARVIQVIVL